MSKILCPKCKGYGEIPDMIERISSLGISWLFEKLAGDRMGWLTCPRCKGKGKIKK